MTLYEIDGMISDFLLTHIDPETGEVTDLSELENLQMTRDAKVENIALAYKNARAEAVALENEIASLKKRLARQEKQTDSLSRYLAFALHGEKFRTSKVDIRFIRSESIEVSDEAVIPAEFLKIKTETKVDKVALKKAVKDGLDIEGVTIVTKQNIHVG